MIRRNILLMLAGAIFLGAFCNPAAAQVQVGYTTLTPDSGTPSPVGSALFTYNNSDGVLVSQTGVGATPPLQAGRIFVDEAGTQTGIALVNPSNQDASVTLSLRMASGAELDRRTITIGAHQHTARYVAELFAGRPPNFMGSLTFESTQALAAVTLREARNVQREPLYTAIPVVNMAAASSNRPTVFPQIAIGGGYTTQVVLVNSSAQAMRGTVSFIDPSGKPLRATLDYDIPANGVYRAELDGGSEVAVGYASVTPAAGTNTPSGTAIFRFQSGGNIITEAGVAADEIKAGRIYVDYIGTQTGLAMANAADQPASLTLTLMDRFGFVENSVPLTMPPHSQLSRFVHELFQVADGYSGLLEIRSDIPITAVALKLTINQRNAIVLTTLPVADLDKPSGSGPLIFPQIAIGGGFSTRLILINTTTTTSVSGRLAFLQSDGSLLTLPLAGQTDSQFDYRITAGGGRQLYPGNTAKLSAISIIDPVSNRITMELPINQGNTVRPRLLMLDSAGARRDDFDAAVTSLDPAIVSVDALGGLHGNKAGFSTLSISAGSIVVAVTGNVVKVEAGVTGFEAAGITQDAARRLYLASPADHGIFIAQDLQQTPQLYAGMAKTPGFRNDLRLQSLFNKPSFIALNQSDGSVYVSDGVNNLIRRVRSGPAGRVETLAGSGSPGSADGATSVASFSNPQGVALDARGNLWVADSGNHTIRRINLVTGIVSTIAGRAGTSGLADGRGSQAQFNSPVGLAIETETTAQALQRQLMGTPVPPVSVLVADTGNGVIRRVNESGDVETIQPGVLRSVSSITRFAAATSNAATFASPTGVAIDAAGNIYVTESESGGVQVILRSGAIVAAAQPGTISNPRGLAIAQDGRIVVAGKNFSAREISYGQPSITSIAPAQIRNSGGQTVTVKGTNFAPDSVVVIAGTVVTNRTITDTQTITFVAPAVPSGRATVTVFNRGGSAQTLLLITSTALKDLPTGYITTIAGGNTFAGEGRTATTVTINPDGITVDAAGNVFFADPPNRKIRRVDARTGILTSVAGSGQELYSGDGGPAIAAGLAFPTGVAFDAAGNMFLSDYNIRKVDAVTGIITPITGRQYGYCGDGGNALDACFNYIFGFAMDSDGTIFIGDVLNQRVRRIDPRTNIITTIAGNGTNGFSGDNGPATSAALSNPAGVAVDVARRILYIADNGNKRVRAVNLQTNIITTAVSVDSRGTTLGGPNALALDPAGNIFISDQGSGTIRKFELETRLITTVAGIIDQYGSQGDGGPATQATLLDPLGLALDSAGNLYITDIQAYVIRKVDAKTQIISTFAGNRQAAAIEDNGPATAAALSSPAGLTFDSAGNLFINDQQNERIRKVDAGTGIITTVAGGGDPRGGIGDGRVATDAKLSIPSGRVVFDRDGNFYIADRDHYRIRKVDGRSNIISTVAGNGNDESTGDGSAPLNAGVLPEDLAIDRRGNLYFAENRTHVVRRFNLANGSVATVAGKGQAGINLGGDLRIAIDLQDNLLIVDIDNHFIWQVDATTGSASKIPGAGSLYTFPATVEVDSNGNLLAVDYGYPVGVLRISPPSTVKRIAGNESASELGDNGPAVDAFLYYPRDAITDASGNVIIADSANHRIRAVRGPIP